MNRNTKLEVSTSRIGIFIDVQNMWYCAKNIGNSGNTKTSDTKLNYPKLLDFVSNGRDVIVANCYLMLKESVDASSFKNALFLSGFDIKKKYMELRDRDGGRKENINCWDVGMAVDMIKWAPKLDTVCLISGSGVFIDAIDYIKNMCRVEVYGFNAYTSAMVKKVCDDFVDLSLPDYSELLLEGKPLEDEIPEVVNTK